jgi:rhomboid family protein
MAAGLFASLVSLSASPVAVSVGASGAVFGLYGLLFASAIWGMIHRSSVSIPLVVLKRLAPAAAVFMLYNVMNGRLEGEGELIGLVLGFCCGLVLARRVTDRTPPERLVTAALATTVVMVVACAVPLSGILDVRPEIDRIVAIERSTAGAYQSAVKQLRDGRVTAEAVARLIDRTIMPQLQAADLRLKALDKVPSEHQPLIASAEEYLKLRSHSWRLRAEGLRERPAVGRLRAETQFRASQARRGEAEWSERISLEVLERIAPVDQKK